MRDPAPKVKQMGTPVLNLAPDPNQAGITTASPEHFIPQ
jgi:hypothetical protein